VAETRITQFTKEHSDIWQSFIVRPGGVFSKTSFSSGLMLMLGKDWVVYDDELGAFMADLAIHGDEKESLIMNRRIVDKGRELLKDI
jgi:hypothetical protein